MSIDLWDKLWTGGLSNPMDAIEQLSYLIFLKRLDDRENAAERQATRRGETYTPRVPAEMRWGHWTQLEAGKALAYLRDVIFPWLRGLGAEGSSFERYMGNAELKINKPALLIEACKLIEGMQIASQNQDVQGDLYEYLLERLSIAGRNGQFRTPRHIARMMVQMIAPQPGERVGDLAGGTCGFGVNSYQYVLEQHTSPEILQYDADGWPHNLVGDLLTPEQREFLQTQFFRAFDNDSGMTMLRIGSMNLMLHGIESPRFFYMDTLSKAYSESREYDVILMNPPFKGAVDKADVNPTLPGNTTKSELLFLHLILRALDMGGRCAVIVPDGVLFGSSAAHVEIRRKLVEENRLDGVVSMPGGVFKPYAGVSHRGAALHPRREDRPHLVLRHGARRFFVGRQAPAHRGERHPRHPGLLAPAPRRRVRGRADGHLDALRSEVAPLKVERLRLHGDINRLTFESVIAPDDERPDRSSSETINHRADDGEADVGRPVRSALEGESRPGRPRSPPRAAAIADRPPEPPVLGDEGAGGGEQVRPFRQPLPAGRAG